MNLQEYRAKLERDAEYKRSQEAAMPMFKLADRVLRLRLGRGWSQTELAKRVGTKQSNISRLERGEGNPTVNFIGRIADALDTTLDIKLVEKLEYPTLQDTDDRPTLISDWPMPQGKKQILSQAFTASTDTGGG